MYWWDSAVREVTGDFRVDWVEDVESLGQCVWQGSRGQCVLQGSRGALRVAGEQGCSAYGRAEVRMSLEKRSSAYDRGCRVYVGYATIQS